MSDFGEPPTQEPVPSAPSSPPPGPPAVGSYPPAAQQPYGYPPAYPQAAYGYGYPGYPGYPVYPGYPRDHPRAGLALGLGIGGLVGGFFTLGLGFALGPFAWYFGQRSRSEIRHANGAYHSDGNATAGMILGIIATVFLALAALFWTFAIIGMSVDSSTNDGTNALVRVTTTLTVSS